MPTHTTPATPISPMSQPGLAQPHFFCLRYSQWYLSRDSTKSDVAATCSQPHRCLWEPRRAVPTCCDHCLESDLSLPGLGLAPKMTRRWGSWIPEGPGQALPGTHVRRGISNLFFLLLFFNFLQNHVSRPNRTLQYPLPRCCRHCGPKGEVPMNKWLPTPEEPSVPLHRASVRKGVRLEALSCPPNHHCPQLLEEKAGPGSLVLLVPARKE